jgi:3-methyladenine DNA glycosylase AlkD
MTELNHVGEVAARGAAQIETEVQALPVKNTAAIRRLRRTYSGKLKGAEPAFILELAQELLTRPGLRWFAYELVRYHKPAFSSLGQTELEGLGQGMNSWHSVDAFARTLSGPAWLNGQVPDSSIHAWARSEDFWWRRAALVSTVALNVRSHGGQGDVPRTLAVCRLLVDDHEDMVEKAMSWALRELVVHDPEAVRAFLSEYDRQLSARVKREVNNKLTTGLKNPKK